MYTNLKGDHMKIGDKVKVIEYIHVELSNKIGTVIEIFDDDDYIGVEFDFESVNFHSCNMHGKENHCRYFKLSELKLVSDQVQLEPRGKYNILSAKHAKEQSELHKKDLYDSRLKDVTTRINDRIDACIRMGLTTFTIDNVWDALKLATYVSAEDIIKEVLELLISNGYEIVYNKGELTINW